MEEDTKKISFSFKQISSKPKIISVASKPVPEKTIQLIDCVEDKSIKVVGLVENNDHELIIPMPSSVKQSLPTKFSKLKQNGIENRFPTLDEMAVQAILSECKETEEYKEVNTRIIEVPMIVNPPEGKEMPTAEDYENIPIDKFGLAMLRGMGWNPINNVDTSSKVITNNSEIRPKGMGLGADKLIKLVEKKQYSEEKLKLKVGSYVQFVLGRLDGQYGQVLGFDEAAARVIVKITRTAQMEKVNENTFRLVTKSDYDKNSKVINIKEYKDYHEGKTMSDDLDIHDERKTKHKDIYSGHRSRYKTKKSKHSKSPNRKHKSDYDRHKKYKHKKTSF